MSERSERTIDDVGKAGALVDATVAAAPGADVEVTVARSAQALTRFANSMIHQNVVDEAADVRLRVHHAGRTVALTTTLPDHGSLRSVVARVLDAVRSGPLDPGWPGVAPAAPIPAPGEVPVIGPASERAALVRAFVDAAGGRETAGYCSTRRDDLVFANSAGHAATAAYSESAFDGIARQDGVDGMGRIVTDTLAEIDGHALGTRAAAKAGAGVDPVELPADRFPVLLEPAAVADLALGFAAYGFNGKAVTQRQSFAEVGAPQFDRSITMFDDAPAVGITFDADGTPTQRLTLVDAGTTAAITYDRRTAAEAGTASTGHALGAGPYGAIATRITISAGAEHDRAAIDAPSLVDPAAAPLLAGVERGILVSDLWYTRVLDPKSLAVTGLTRNGVWLVEDGDVATPVKNLRFTQAYPAALAPGAVNAVGPVARGCTGGWFTVRWTVPAVHLASWNFTGGASG